MTEADLAALVARGVGITNLVRRATARADELTQAELVEGGARLEEFVAQHRPRVVAVLGVTAYRLAFARPRAALGRQPGDLAGAELWVVPNPSGLNAHETIASLATAYAEPARGPGSSVSVALERCSPMADHAHGTFEVTITPHDSDDRHRPARDRQAWLGDLAGTGHGLMLSAGDPAQGHAGYVALEIVEGTLNGRSGSFALQQLGVMSDGDQELRYDVVPGSGTGELAGIRRHPALTIEDDGSHRYDLAYTLT